MSDVLLLRNPALERQRSRRGNQLQSYGNNKSVSDGGLAEKVKDGWIYIIFWE